MTLLILRYFSGVESKTNRQGMVGEELRFEDWNYYHPNFQWRC